LKILGLEIGGLIADWGIVDGGLIEDWGLRKRSGGFATRLAIAASNRHRAGRVG
jgi:hypothetical protein